MLECQLIFVQINDIAIMHAIYMQFEACAYLIGFYLSKQKRIIFFCLKSFVIFMIIIKYETIRYEYNVKTMTVMKITRIKKSLCVFSSI